MSTIYNKEAYKIKRTLASFELGGFLDAVYDECNSEEYSNGAPRIFWCRLLILKWKLSLEKDGSRKASRLDIEKLVRRVLELQSYAFDFSNKEGFDLEMRRVVFSQGWYQNKKAVFANDICRDIFFYSNEKALPSRELFLNKTGLDLIQFMKIALVIYVSLIDVDKEMFYLKISKLLAWLHPTFSLDEIAIFLSIVSCDIQQLREYARKNTPDGSPNWEYYEYSPFIFKSVFLYGDSLGVLSKSAFFRGIHDIPMKIFRDNSYDIKSVLGPLKEQYIDDLLSKIGVKYIDEKAIEDLYRENSVKKKKVVDFVVEDKGNTIYIESKSIEPNHFARTMSSKDCLVEKLRSSFLKSAVQIAECSSAYSMIKKEDVNKSYGLSVLSEDFLFPTAKSAFDMLGLDIKDSVKELEDGRYCSAKNIFYITLDDLDYFADICDCNNESFSYYLGQFVKQSLDKESLKINFWGYLSDIKYEGVRKAGKIHEIRTHFLSDAANKKKFCKKHYSDNIGEFIPDLSSLMKKIVDMRNV